MSGYQVVGGAPVFVILTDQHGMKAKVEKWTSYYRTDKVQTKSGEYSSIRRDEKDTGYALLGFNCFLSELEALNQVLVNQLNMQHSILLSLLELNKHIAEVQEQQSKAGQPVKSSLIL